MPIEDCYGVKFEGPRTYDIFYRENILPIDVVQNGQKVANYALQVEGPEWVKLEQNGFTLKPGEQYSFNLIAEPDNVSTGDYNVVIDINADSVVYRRELTLRLRNEESGFLGMLNYYRYYIYSGLIILILIILLIIILKERARVWKIRKMIKKAVNNGKNKKKFNFFPFIILFIVLAVAVFILWLNFPSMVMDFLRVYIGYILAGLVILGIIIFILSGNSKE